MKRNQAIATANQQFDRMDLSEKGFVTRADIMELRQAQAVKMNVAFGDEEVDSFMQSFDTQGVGRVTR